MNKTEKGKVTFFNFVKKKFFGIQLQAQLRQKDIDVFWFTQCNKYVAGMSGDKHLINLDYKKW